MVGGAGIRLGMTATSPAGLWWDEQRPAEGGRVVVRRRDPDGTVHDLVPEGFSARSRVHEYGGGSFCVHGDTLFFSNWSDQRLYRVDPGSQPVAITPEPEKAAGTRYADGDVTPDGRFVLCVRETHRRGAEPVNDVVAVPATGGAPQVAATDHDFFSFPRVSPDGARIAWTSWDHPDMPWDATTLWVATLAADGTVSDPRAVAGGGTESVFAPKWGPDGALYLVSDRTGWWNIHRVGDTGVEQVVDVDAELGFPQWVFGMSSYAIMPGGEIVCAHGRDGFWRLGLVRDGSLEDLGLPYTSVTAVSVFDGRAAFVGATPTDPPSVVLADVVDGSVETVRRSADITLDPAYVSVPEAVDFPVTGGTSHAFLYRPVNPDHAPAEGERPPLIVLGHGGPTSHTTAILNLSVQFWTTRGFAVVDVNYRGSTGYGRAYRDALKGAWGIADVEDLVAAARYLADRGEVDPDRAVIRGGSAGGYAVLCALAFHDVFAAGANYYGVADLEALARDTHKFEARYLDRLVGPYPERADVYRQRSPLHHAGGIRSPLITFQGMEDEVVPPSQSEAIVAALRDNGVPHAYIAFEGEQHGFRSAETIARALEAELAFYGRVLGFEPAGDLPPLSLDGV